MSHTPSCCAILDRLRVAVPALLILLVVTTINVLGAASADTEKNFRPLFNGKNLDGWYPVNTAPSTWSVKDGVLHCSGMPTGELRTDRMYQNYVLELEWRHMKPRGNAGIFVWADDITARGQPFHRGIEVQVLENAYGDSKNHTTHGDIFPIHGAKMTPINGRGGSRAFPTESRSKPSPEWNHYRITCVDGEISLAVNGKVVTRGKDCSPRKGYICIESEGGVAEYRNIRIKELPASALDPEHVAIADRGYRSLYTGVDLSGWKLSQGGKGGWKAQNWVLAHQGAKGGDRGESKVLESEESFGDFGFIFDVRFKKGSGASRLQLRGSERAEISLSTGGDLLRAAKIQPGSWQRFEGTMRGSVLKLSLNGQVLIESKKLEDVPGRGPLRFIPVGTIDFANIYVRKLKPEERL